MGRVFIGEFGWRVADEAIIGKVFIVGMDSKSIMVETDILGKTLQANFARANVDSRKLIKSAEANVKARLVIVQV